MVRQHRGSGTEGRSGAGWAGAAVLALVLAGCAQAPVKPAGEAKAPAGQQAQKGGEQQASKQGEQAAQQVKRKASPQANGKETGQAAQDQEAKMAAQGQAAEAKARPAPPRLPDAAEVRQAVEAMLAHPRTLFASNLGNIYLYFVGGALDARYSPARGTLSLKGLGDREGKACTLTRDGQAQAQGGEAAPVCRALLDTLQGLLREEAL